MLRAGVDLGGTKIEALVLDDDHRPVGQSRQATPTSGGPPAVLETIALAVREASSETGGTDALAGVGVGSPGVVDQGAGTVTSARNLTDWDGTFPLGPRLSEALGGITVRVGNDVALALDAEVALGAGRSHPSLLGVWWGTGVGGSLVLDRRRLPGGEFGHTVVRQGGRRCGCGRRGCLEAYAGRGSMERRARQLADRGVKTELFRIAKRRERDRLTSGVWAKAVEEGDRLAEHLIKRAIGAIGVGAASVRNLVEYDAVVLGGGLGTRFADTTPGRIAEEMQPHLFVPERAPAVVAAELGDLAGAIGAARLIGP